MNLFRMFGFGSQKIISQGYETTGAVTAVDVCWWIKINTKPVRRHPLDGARFPHIITFTYSVNGVSYQGSRYVRYYLRCPGKGETIPVFYDKSDPAQYAVSLYGVSL